MSQTETTDAAAADFEPLALQKQLYAKALATVEAQTEVHLRHKRLRASQFHASVQLPPIKDASSWPGALNLETLASQLQDARVVLISQYQTLPECRHNVVALIKQMQQLDPQTPLACCLDQLSQEQQPLLEALSRGEMTLSQFDQQSGLIKKLGPRQWQSLQPLLQLSVNHANVQLLATDANRTDATFAKRNAITLEAVQKWLQQHPQGICLVLAGERRLMEGELYEELQSWLQNYQPEAMAPVVILQAWEEAYWQLVAAKASDAQKKPLWQSPVLQWRDHLYSMTPVPPLVKLDSFLTWSHHQEAWPGWPPQESLREMRRQLRNTLQLPLARSGEHPRQDPQVYCCGDLELLERIRNRDRLTDAEADGLLKQIVAGESYYLPAAQLIYLATLDGYHMGEEVGHSLRSELTGETEPPATLDVDGQLFYLAIHEAAGYLASKIVAPGRKPGREAMRLSQRLANMAARDKKPVATNQVANNQKHAEQIWQQGHQAGYGLAEKLYQEWQRGSIKTSALKPLYLQSVQTAAEAKQLYLQLYRLSEEIALPVKQTLHKRLHLVAAFYFLLLFLPAFIWGEARELWLFPKPLSANLGRDLMLVLLSALTVIAVSAVLSRFAAPFRRLAELMRKLLGPLTYQEIVLLAGFSAIAEELFFRGVLQAEIGLVAASLLFGLVHFGADRRLLPWFFFATAVGFLLGWIYMVTGNLLVPMATHFLINLVNTYLLVMKKRQKTDS